ncbi:hypothetical protein [Polaribacter sp. IC073]|uniref:hypothetical protein n=1 Tax=Polaribacter sp. IC073 TaxID=2508540 RepID=UPI0011BE5054|nr:hypothetical protein [Polaribacter sp. IC073]TXD47347.1 hypothetical protein ES045_12175 [Polaribacter sp. IC073]
MKTKRLEILENSLIKKSTAFDEKLQNHFKTVKQANGQPLNDKRNGQATLNKWEKQNDSLRTLQESIEKTKNAIENEKGKILDVESEKEYFPTVILEMIESGVLIQWRKHPNTLFVNGVDKARIHYDKKKEIVSHKYIKQVTDKEQFKTFAKAFNHLHKNINLK